VLCSIQTEHKSLIYTRLEGDSVGVTKPTAALMVEQYKDEKVILF
jgi:hypothetical protein